MSKVRLVLASAVLVPVFCAAANELTVISFGRADQNALSKAYFGPFQSQTGIEVRSLSYDGETTEVRLLWSDALLSRKLASAHGFPPVKTCTAV